MPSKRLGENPAVRVSSTSGKEASKGRLLTSVSSLDCGMDQLSNANDNGEETYKPC